MITAESIGQDYALIRYFVVRRSFSQTVAFMDGTRRSEFPAPIGGGKVTTITAFRPRLLLTLFGIILQMAYIEKALWDVLFSENDLLAGPVTPPPHLVARTPGIQVITSCP